MVYGAGPDNPVPLTEDAAIRPEPALPYALARAELERLVADYRDGGPDRTVAVLAAAVILHAGSTEWLRRSPWGRRGPPSRRHHGAAPVRASRRCRRRHRIDVRPRLDGTYNVAPDGWMAGETFRRLGRRCVGAVAGARQTCAVDVATSRLRTRRSPPGVEPYTEHSWVIASDRLRAEGWQPAHTSEETLVEADPARGWRALSPRARQELSLGCGRRLGCWLRWRGAVVLVRRRVIAPEPDSNVRSGRAGLLAEAWPASSLARRRGGRRSRSASPGS